MQGVDTSLDDALGLRWTRIERLFGLCFGLGCFDNERGRVEPGPNPFVPDNVLTM